MKREPRIFENLPASTPYDAALDKAMKLLTVSARSRHEMVERLGRAGYDAQTIASVETRLLELGLLDDEVFASDLAERAAARGHAPGMIRAALAKKGVAPEIVERALSQASPPDAERERALELAHRRARAYGDLPAHVARRRLMGFLAGKGYNFDLITEVSAEVLGTP